MCSSLDRRSWAGMANTYERLWVGAVVSPWRLEGDLDYRLDDWGTRGPRIQAWLAEPDGKMVWEARDVVVEESEAWS